MLLTFIILTAISLLLLLSTVEFGKDSSEELKEATKEMKESAIEFSKATRKAVKELYNEIKRSMEQ